MPPREGIYGLLAEFNTPSELVHATEQAHEAGYRRMECYTPYPVEEAAVALRFHKTRVPLVCLLGGIMGRKRINRKNRNVNSPSVPMKVP